MVSFVFSNTNYIYSLFMNYFQRRALLHYETPIMSKLSLKVFGNSLLSSFFFDLLLNLNGILAFQFHFEVFKMSRENNIAPFKNCAFETTTLHQIEASFTKSILDTFTPFLCILTPIFNVYSHYIPAKTNYR